MRVHPHAVQGWQLSCSGQRLPALCTVFSINSHAGIGEQPSYSGQRLLALYPCIFFLFETSSRMHPTTLILPHCSFPLLLTMTPEPLSSFPNPVAVSHRHWRPSHPRIPAILPPSSE